MMEAAKHAKGFKSYMKALPPPHNDLVSVILHGVSWYLMDAHGQPVELEFRKQCATLTFDCQNFDSDEQQDKVLRCIEDLGLPHMFDTQTLRLDVFTLADAYLVQGMINYIY